MDDKIQDILDRHAGPSFAPQNTTAV